jgi:hypothetical protein
MLKILSNASLVSLITVVCFVSCSKLPLQDPAADDLSDLSIDPDQPALPANVSGNSSEKSVPAQKSDVAFSEQRVNNIETPPTSSSKDLNAERHVVKEVSVEPEAPMNQAGAESEKVSSRFGSGPQIRYIKAVELNVREKPDRYSQIVGVLKGGDKVRVKVKGGWAKLDEGRWIRSRWLVKQKPTGAFAQDSNQTESQSSVQKSRKKRDSKSSRKKKIKPS